MHGMSAGDLEDDPAPPVAFLAERLGLRRIREREHRADLRLHLARASTSPLMVSRTMSTSRTTVSNWVAR